MNFSNDTHPIDIDIFEKTIYSNFTISLKINNYLYKRLNGNPSKIIYIGSTASLHAKASPSYTLSKSLINTYVKNVSKFYLDYNILICVVLPGILDHEGSVWHKKKESNQEYYNSVKNEQPLKRFAKPKDIAPYVIDIVHQKSLLLTGSIVKLDANSY
jgi:NAD(P)-dependent dehydrogenase (short-subunit alcohol dehydrogenase family)